jgi:FAD/FMN-containing dehydrogenase
MIEIGSDTIIRKLRGITGTEYATNAPYELWCYKGYNLPQTPVAVVRPENTKQVAGIVMFALENKIPLIPRGLASRATPAGNRPYPSTKGGIIIETTRMNKIRNINTSTMTVTAEAGLTLSQLSTELVQHGYRIIIGTLAPFCATVGSLTGNGPGAIKYGTRQEQVVDLEVVLGTGEILQTEPGNFGARMCAKYTSPNLTDLFLKARGTFGIVTAVTFYMHVLPEAVAFRNFAFNDHDRTVKFLLKLQEQGLTHLPGVFEVYVWPEETLLLYKNNPRIYNQNEEFKRLLSSFPPFPADIVGIVLEGTGDQIKLQEKLLEDLASECSGVSVGQEPVRDHYADCIWSGNTKAHEDRDGRFDTFAEPHFETQIDSYPDACEMTARIAEELGFLPGERYWRGSRLSRRMLTHSAAITFNDLDPGERERAGEYYARVYAEAVRYKSMADGRIDTEGLEAGKRLHAKIKKIVDPDNIVYPGVEMKEE